MRWLYIANSAEDIIDAAWLLSLPRYFLSVLALEGDSTISNLDIETHENKAIISKLLW